MYSKVDVELDFDGHSAKSFFFNMIWFISMSFFYAILFIGCIPIVFVGVDVWSAYKTSKHWIPGDSLVLGALALQLLTLLTRPFVNKFYYDHDPVSNVGMFAVAERVSLCVFIGCLLPGVACPRNAQLWSNMAAFIISSSFAIFYISYDICMIAVIYSGNSSLLDLVELVYSAKRSISGVKYLENFVMDLTIESSTDSGDRCYMSSSPFAFIVWSSTIVVSLLILVLVLVCAVLASLSTNNIVFYKIPFVLSTPHVCSWKNVKEQLLKSWIVVTTSNPQYIIARSILPSSIALVITICNGILVSQTWCCAYISAFTPFSIVIPFILNCVFILIGSAVIYWRCITAVVYYPKDIKWEWQSVTQYFEIEDFWKKHLLRLKDDGPREEGQSYVTKLVIKLCIKVRLNKLLVAVLWLQTFLVVFSKGCWLLAQACLSNRYLRKLVMGSTCEEFYFLWASPQIQPERYIYEKYLKAVIIMQGENPAGLWIAMRKSFEKIKKHMASGEQKGKGSQELVNLLKNKSSPVFEGQKCLEPQNGILLGLEVESGLEICKSSIKMTTVSILTIIIELSSIINDGNQPTNQGMVNEVIKACSQAWNIFDTVENSDRGKALVTEAADQVFKTLQQQRKKWLDYDLPISNSRGSSIEAAKTALETLAEKGKQIAKGYKSREWKEVVAGYSLYSLCFSINCDFDNAEALLDEMVRMVADVTGSCIAKAWSVIAEDCKKWAADCEEEIIWNASHVAGIVNGLTESVGDKLKPSTHDH